MISSEILNEPSSLRRTGFYYFVYAFYTASMRPYVSEEFGKSNYCFPNRELGVLLKTSAPTQKTMHSQKKTIIPKKSIPHTQQR